MEPVNPVVEEGGTLVLNCTILDTYDGPYNASDISFLSAGYEFNRTNVHVLSSATAQLVLPHVTVEDHGNKLFICGMPDKTNFAHQSVTVGRKCSSCYTCTNHSHQFCLHWNRKKSRGIFSNCNFHLQSSTVPLF